MGETGEENEVWNGLKEYILDKQPDLLFVEEMLISCYESIDFIGELKKIGYYYIEEYQREEIIL